MGHVEVNGVAYSLPDGRPLLADVSFQVDHASCTALVGPNGCGKSTLLRMIERAAERSPGSQLCPENGSISVEGSLAVMSQFVGRPRDATTVRDLLVSVAPAELRSAGQALDEAHGALQRDDDEAHQLAFARALADWGDLGGYEAEVAWDAATTDALGLAFAEAAGRPVRTLSGGEQKRLLLSALFSSRADLLLLDEPDNYLDVAGKEWLEEMLQATRKTVLFVSHDRELLRRSATRVVTLEWTAAGSTAWVHGASYATYHEARLSRLERLEELGRRWDEEHERLRAYVVAMRQKASYNSDFASKLTNALHRLERFEKAGPPEAVPRPPRLSVRLRGAATGKRAVTCRSLALTGLTHQFDLEVIAGERVCCLGPNGSGKSHFLRLLAGADVAHSGQFALGARVVAGHFAQTHEHEELIGREVSEMLARDFDLSLEGAVASLGRYELAAARRQTFESLSGGQQARLQILMLELSGSTLLLLDEPTDNLDVESAEALEGGLDTFEGTVIAVTHDRFFARQFDRFLLFSGDGSVEETPTPVFSESSRERAAGGRKKARVAGALRPSP